MKKILALAALLLGLCAPVIAQQQPLSVQYAKVNPTGQCRAGYTWVNTTSHTTFACDTSTNPPTWFAVGNTGATTFPVRSTNGANIVELNGVAGDPNTSAWFATDGGTKFAGFNLDVETAGVFTQWQAAEGNTAFQIDVNAHTKTANYLYEDPIAQTRVDRHISLNGDLGPFNSDFVREEIYACGTTACSYYQMGANHGQMKRSWFDPGGGQSVEETFGNGSAQIVGTNNANFTTTIALTPGNLVSLQFNGLGGGQPFTSTQVDVKGVKDAMTGTQPTCDVDARGYRWRIEGGTGVGDTYQVCLKGSDDTYSWREIATMDSFLPPIQVVRMELTENQIRNLNSTPITLVAAPGAGLAAIPEFINYKRNVGTAYTIGSATTLQILLNAVPYDSQTIATMLTSGTGPFRRMMYNVNGGGSPYGVVSAVTSARDDTNKAITVKINGGNVSGGSGTLEIDLFYRVWSTTGGM